MGGVLGGMEDGKIQLAGKKLFLLLPGSPFKNLYFYGRVFLVKAGQDFGQDNRTQMVSDPDMDAAGF